jgi:RNA-binding protein 25
LCIWDLQADIVEQKLRPWIARKIADLLGEEEESLIKFVCTKLNGHTPPAELVDNLAHLVDEEALPFVIKLWRMLLFEIARSKRS